MKTLQITVLLITLSLAALFVNPMDSEFVETVYAKKKSRKRSQNILQTKKAKAITKRQASRLVRIDEHKLKGLIGETTQGLLKIRTLSGVSKKSRKKLEKLVQSENQDRNRLYKIMVDENKFDKKNETLLRMNMFKSRFDLEPIGNYYYENRTWRKK